MRLGDLPGRGVRGDGYSALVPGSVVELDGRIRVSPTGGGRRPRAPAQRAPSRSLCTPSTTTRQVPRRSGSRRVASLEETKTVIHGSPPSIPSATRSTPEISYTHRSACSSASENFIEIRSFGSLDLDTHGAGILRPRSAL